LIAETAIAHAAVKAGISVLRPLGDERYDFVFSVGRRFLRVQCKAAVDKGDVLVVGCRSCRRSPQGFRHSRYTADEIDAIAAHCATLDRCFFLPWERFRGRSAIQLRFAPARNNQRRGINWADEFDFRWLNWSALLGP
jgi:hypothetical protein